MSIKLPVAANISLDNVSSKSIVLQSHPSSYELLQQGDCDEWLHITSETTWSGMKKSWKSTVAVGAVTAGIVLLVNLGFLVYMISRRGFGIASFTLYTGSEDILWTARLDCWANKLRFMRQDKMDHTMARPADQHLEHATSRSCQQLRSALIIS